MTDSEILALANARGYAITGTTPSVIRNEFLSEQELLYKFTQSELNTLTISEISDIARARGYAITQTLKADIIREFLDEQNS